MGRFIVKRKKTVKKVKREFRTETLIKRTQKRYPDARVVRDEYGLYYIMDMHNEDIFEEFFVPHQPTERLAWEMGNMTASTVQNFNRAHPLKVELTIEDAEMKALRMSRRKKKKK